MRPHTVSVCVTTCENLRFLPDNLAGVLASGWVSEIIISDDASTLIDWKNSIEEVTEIFEEALGIPLSRSDEGDSIEMDFHPMGNGRCHLVKLRMLRNNTRLGAFRNKLRAVSLASNEWALLLDVDNVFTLESVELLCHSISWDLSCVYAPSQIRIFPDRGPFDLENEAQRARTHQQLGIRSFVSNRNLGASFFRRLMNSKFLRSKYLAYFFLNTGNFLVPRARYVEVAEAAIGSRTADFGAADVIAFSTSWLDAGYVFQLVEGSYYFHRTHSGSFWARFPSMGPVRVIAQEFCGRESPGVDRTSLPEFPLYFALLPMFILYKSILGLPATGAKLSIRFVRRGMRARSDFFGKLRKVRATMKFGSQV